MSQKSPRKALNTPDMLRLLAQGIDPISNEKISGISQLNNLVFVRNLIGLADAIEALPASVKKSHSKEPQNHGKHWDETSNQELTQLFTEDMSPKLIAGKMGRTQGAIVAQLNKLGLIDDDERLSYQ